MFIGLFTLLMIRRLCFLILVVGLLIILTFHMIFSNKKIKEVNCDLCFQKNEFRKTLTKIENTDFIASPNFNGDQIIPKERAKAAIVILARNSDIEGLSKTIPMFEKIFNQRYNYPYVFLNDVPFNEDFKNKINQLTNSSKAFGEIPKEHWSYPEWINQTLADEKRNDMQRRNIIYGGSLPYRHMCRFNSGFFFRHELLKEYDYYWRIEPWVEFYCDLRYDPFMYMKENNLEYGFTIMVPEYIETIPTLWDTTKSFMKENPKLIPAKNSIDIFTKDDGGYNLCHFWSNFEIASLNFLRGEAYSKYFEYLDKKGGFFYERWGDAPVHSIAATMFLPIEKIHWFEDIGYYHAPFSNCPSNPNLSANCKCNWKKSNNLRNDCHKKYLEMKVRSQ